MESCHHYLMKLQRRHIPYALLVILISSQVIVIGLRIDIWPFTYYPMFSTLHTTEDVGAYRMEATTRDNRTLTMHLRGSKNIWHAYEILLSRNDVPGLQSQMKRDMEYYLKQNPEIKVSDLSELRLIYMGLNGSTYDEKFVNKKILHSIKL